MTSSITEDFGMVCGDSYQKALFIALYALGRLIGKIVNTEYVPTMILQSGLIFQLNISQQTLYLLGSFVVGFISDSYGRLKAIIFSILVMCVAGIAEAFIYNKILLAILRVIYGIGGQGIVLASFVLAAESTLPKYSVVITTLPGRLPQFDNKHN